MDTSPVTTSDATDKSDKTDKSDDGAGATGTQNETRRAAEPGQVSAQTNTGTLSSSGSKTSDVNDEVKKDEKESEPSKTEEPGKQTELASGQEEVEKETEEETATQPVVEDETKQDDETENETVPPVDTKPVDTKGSDHDPATSPTTQPGSTTTALTVQSSTDPGSVNQDVKDVAVFVDARTLAASGPLNLSPEMAAQTTEDLVEVTETEDATDEPDLLTAAVEVVSDVVDALLNPLAGNTPIDPSAPLAWTLLAVARRELDTFIDALAGGAEEEMTLASAQTMSLALATPPPTVRPVFPQPGQWLSVSTQFVDWITGNNPANNTQFYYGVTGTDLGIMWDNGMVDDLSTPYNEHQILIAFGDTFGVGGMAAGTHWRPNVLFRSVDADLFDGLDFTDPEWFTGNDFGGSPLTYVPPNAPYQYMARQIIFPSGLPAGITLIPTAGISVPTPGTQYEVTQYISFMSVTKWGAPGQWTTNYSAIAYSEDNGETWTVAPQTVRYNTPGSGNQNFQQMAFVRPGDGYVYAYGTPNGRLGSAYVARVPERDILDLSKYEYWNGGTAGGWYGVGATPARWVKGNPAAATAIFGQTTTTPGACGAVNVNPGSGVSEMSVQYNQHLEKFVVLHADRNNSIIMRTSDRPEGGWSGPKVLMKQQNGGIYAPMMHPWSPSTKGTGSELYWNLSLWSEYNVMLMKTDLDKVK
ncbi:DUF4185 domain-containing protein [Mycobacterium barrassiae]|uniref:DUF4185 domain-containing protein n=1 Tax=Mycobacterium barrassiae TaxID=319709 RepID=UPI002265BB3A|nr:DUF4185 domain-containing protein [Mycobacterium barrassiae]